MGSGSASAAPLSSIRVRRRLHATDLLPKPVPWDDLPERQTCRRLARTGRQGQGRDVGREFATSLGCTDLRTMTWCLLDRPAADPDGDFGALFGSTPLGWVPVINGDVIRDDTHRMAATARSRSSSGVPGRKSVVHHVPASHQPATTRDEGQDRIPCRGLPNPYPPTSARIADLTVSDGSFTRPTRAAASKRGSTCTSTGPPTPSLRCRTSAADPRPEHRPGPAADTELSNNVHEAQSPQHPGLTTANPTAHLLEDQPVHATRTTDAQANETAKARMKPT